MHLHEVIMCHAIEICSWNGAEFTKFDRCTLTLQVRRASWCAVDAPPSSCSLRQVPRLHSASAKQISTSASA